MAANIKLGNFLKIIIFIIHSFSMDLLIQCVFEIAPEIIKQVGHNRSSDYWAIGILM